MDTIISFKGLGAVRANQIDHAFVEEGPHYIKLHMILKSCATYAVPFKTIEEAQIALEQVTMGLQGRSVKVVR